jgi:hypothetical protein
VILHGLETICLGPLYNHNKKVRENLNLSLKFFEKSSRRQMEHFLQRCITILHGLKAIRFGRLYNNNKKMRENSNLSLKFFEKKWSETDGAIGNVR